MTAYTGNTEEFSGTLALAYGEHVVSGHVIQKVTEGIGDTARTTVIVWLGEGVWNRIKYAYWGGGEIPAEDYHFHNGYISDSMAEATFGTAPSGMEEWTQGVDPWNVGGQTYSGTAYVIIKLPVGITSEDDLGKLKFICECARVANYDGLGRQLDSGDNVVGAPNDPPNPAYFFYSKNPALIMADLLLYRRKLAKTRINWNSWALWRDFCNANITWVGGTIAGRPQFQGLANVTEGIDSSLIKSSGTHHVWDAGAATTGFIADGLTGFYEFDAGTGYAIGGLTNDTSPRTNADFALGVQFQEPEDGSRVFLRWGSSQATLPGTWVTGDRFRVAWEGEWRVYKNGVPVDISSFGVPAPSFPLYGGFAAYSLGGEILRSTMSPATAPASGTERIRKRFDCGLAFTGQTDVDTARQAILYVSCSEMQDADGKLVFLPPTMSSAPRTSVFSFDASNILPDTFKTYRLSRDQKPTRLVVKFRDSDSAVLKEDSVVADRDALVSLLGRENPAPEVYVGTMTRGQAQCIANYYIRRNSDLDLYCSFQAYGTSWKALPGDVVDVTEESENWVNVEFEVIDAVDESSIDTPDVRGFLCQLFNEATYSDTDQTPLNANVSETIVREIDTPRTPTGYTATQVLNTLIHKWDDKPADRLIIKRYEIWSSTDTSNPANLLWSGPANGWVEPLSSVVGGSVTRYLRAISVLEKASPFATLTKNLDAVPPPSNYTITNTGSIAQHRWSPSDPASAVVRYEVATDALFTNIIFSGLDTAFDEPISGSGSITRYLRAVGFLDKVSTTVTATTSFDGPAAPTLMNVFYDGYNLDWTWEPSASAGVTYYEITNSTGTVILERVPHTADPHWIEPQVRGTATYNRRVYSINGAGQRSSTFLVLGYTIPAPNPISGGLAAYDSASGLIKWSWTASSSIDVESYALSHGTLPALVANKNATSILENPTDGFPSFTRAIRVVSTNGQQSSAVNVTFTAPTPSAPTITLNRAYPSVSDVTVTSSNSSRAILKTVVRVSTATGGGFDGGVIQTLPEAGKQDRVTVFGRVSTNPTLYVKVHYIDVWGQTSSYSNELTLTFVAFPGADVGLLESSNLPSGIIQAIHFAAAIEPVTLVTSVPATLLTRTIFNTTDGKLYKWNGTAYVAAISASEISGQITTTQIADDAITTPKLAANAVDADALQANSVVAGKVAAGAINADAIAANAVAATKLVVGNFDNLVEDPGGEKTGFATWTLGAGMSDQSGGSGHNGSGHYIDSVTANSYAMNPVYADCKEGDKFYCEGWVAATGGAAGYVVIGWYDASKALISYSQSTGFSGAFGVYGLTSVTATAPATTKYARAGFRAGSGTPGWLFDDLYMRRLIGTAIIEDASITTAKINSATITELTVHEVFADDIVAATGDIGLLFADDVVARDYAGWVNASTQLNGSLSDSATSIVVDSTSGFLTSAALQIGEEIVYYTGKNSTTFTGVTRGRDGTTAVSHLDNTPVLAKGKGWRLNPERGTSNPGVVELHSGGLINDVPIREVQARATYSIDNSGYVRGPDRGVVPTSVISYGFYDDYGSDGENDRAYAAFGVTIDSFRDASGLSNCASIDHAEVLIKNKFGETLGTYRYRAWTGRGAVYDGWHERKYADAWEEAVYVIRIHNLYGYSAPIYISSGLRNPSWGGGLWGTTPVVFISKQDCPMDLTAVSTAPDTIVLNWSPAVTSGAQTIRVRAKGADNRWSTWSNITTSLGTTTGTYTWSAASPNTAYEFQTMNNSVSGAFSNIAWRRTLAQSATAVGRVAPSGVVGSAQNATTIVWSWAVNATGNSDVEYSLDGGSWTSLGSATANTTTSTVSAGTTHTLRVRNVWSSGTTYSPEASSNAVTTVANNPVNTDPSNLSLSIPARHTIRATWTNNGTVNQTVQWQLTGGDWTSLAGSATPGAVATYDITGLPDSTFYDVRVRATSGSNYITGGPISTQNAPDDDPWCVELESSISLYGWMHDEAKNVVAGDIVKTGKSNDSEIKKAWFGKTSSLLFVTNEFGDVLGCSPSHPFVANMEETEIVRAKEIAHKISQGEEVFVKMNDLGREYMAKVFSVENLPIETQVWIAELSHNDHTFIANRFVCHNIRAKLYDPL